MRLDTRILNGLHDAFDHIDEAKDAMDAGRYTHKNIVAVMAAHATLARVLSDDWRANKAAPSKIDRDLRTVIMRYVWIAGDQLDCIAAFNNPHRKEVATDTGGRWLVARTITIDSVDYRNERLCNNPAFGSAQLDEWETYLRASLPKLKVAA